MNTIMNNLKKNYIRFSELVKSHTAPADTLALDELVHPSLEGNTEEFFFIQIGANDGAYRDPIHKYVKKYKWPGILVEPVPAYFKALRQNYVGNDQLIFENAAIGDIDGSRKLYRVNDQAKLIARWYRGIASFNKAHLIRHRFAFANIEKNIIEEDVKCLTLASLMKKHKVKKVDLLVMDVEGYEFNIIQQIQALSVKPLVIIFEHRHMPFQQLEVCDGSLKQLGYEVTYSIDDGIAILNKC